MVTKPSFQQTPKNSSFAKDPLKRTVTRSKPISSSERDARKEDEWLKRGIEQRKLKAKKQGPATFRLGDQLKEALNRVKK